MTSRGGGNARLRIHSLLVFLVCLFLKHLPVMSVSIKSLPLSRALSVSLFLLTMR